MKNNLWWIVAVVIGLLVPFAMVPICSLLSRWVTYWYN